VKITNIKTFIHSPHWNLILVKIETDEGIVGWGEATTQGQERNVEASIQNLAHYLMGKDPRHIERHWSTMFRDSFWRPSLIVTCAMSGLEIAMWDIFGKSLGVPIHALLGGPCHDRIKIYHNGWWFEATSIDDYVGLAEREVKERGAKALKWDPFWGCDVFTTERADFDRIVENVGRVREVVGNDVELMLDGHGRFSPNTAIQFAHAVEKYRPSWYEEPIPIDASPEDLARVAASTEIPIVTGERIPTRWCFRDLFEKRAVTFINPDIAHAGGILETKKIADMAHAYYVGVTPHNSAGPILNAASLHLDACMPNFVTNEFFPFDLPHWNEILVEPFPPPRDGFLDIPTKPGLGIEIDEEKLQATNRPYVYHDLSSFWRSPRQPSTG